jgi:beta-phosphoglucomutase-like phosphatase (HAD superfamily)
MEMAAVKPHEAIVIENAPLGVEAGARSGAFTVAVTTGPIPAEAMWEAGADMVLPSMTVFAALLPALLERR